MSAAQSQPPVRLVAGLGNPGPRYAATRHNVGFRVAERLAAEGGAEFRDHSRVPARVAEWRDGGLRWIALQPSTFMNLSGQAVSAALRFWKLGTESLLAVVDDVELKPGEIRLRGSGSDGGHNGLKSIRRSLGTGDWYRIRIGVGRGRGEAADHVLSRFARHEAAGLDDLLQRAADCTECLVTDGLATAQNRYNS